jgi:hypothetical protein
MWQAIRARKLERIIGKHGADAYAAWGAAVHRSEDGLTSGVLERLGYLPDGTGLEIVFRASTARGLHWIPISEPVVESLPWPRFDCAETWVEPDWVWLTHSYVVAFEAKWGHGVVPTVDQLRAQALACEARWPRRRLVQVALVQSGEVTFPAGVNGVVAQWSRIHDATAHALTASVVQSERRILIDIRDILLARGVAAKMMDSLPDLVVAGALTPLINEHVPYRIGVLPEIVIDLPRTF